MECSPTRAKAAGDLRQRARTGRTPCSGARPLRTLRCASVREWAGLATCSQQFVWSTLATRDSVFDQVSLQGALSEAPFLGAIPLQRTLGGRFLEDMRDSA
eukprot:CAMPEP_0171172434 /NCGR_PEP_ID=MMETSP0790-20130122/9718_1 /TAXON_ID=2925 /ORGANISM="Alexandrium catenella, Strain OF101" /LENGTH=100 /DNA_ID=CAMNT_0011637293 /DNA_START=121 /DNA_END=424 /DNA_ORIENTATION=-